MRARTIPLYGFAGFGFAVVGLAAVLGCAARTPDGPAGLPAAVEPAAAAAAYAGPVIDIHAHVYFDEAVARSVSADPLATPEGFAAATADARLTHVGAIVMAARPDAVATRARNDALLAFTAADPRRFCIGSVHPDEGVEAIAEVNRLAARGCKMLKLHPVTQRLDLADPAVSAVVQAAADAKLPVLIDFSGALNAAEFGDYLQLAVTHPEAQLVLAHMGATRFADVAILKMLERYPWFQRNIWFDLSAVAALYADSPYEDELRWVVRTVGVDRVMFGSDFPVRRPRDAVQDVQRLGFSADEMQLIFEGNAARLLGLRGQPSPSATSRPAR